MVLSIRQPVHGEPCEDFLSGVIVKRTERQAILEENPHGSVGKNRHARVCSRPFPDQFFYRPCLAFVVAHPHGDIKSTSGVRLRRSGSDSSAYWIGKENSILCETLILPRVPDHASLAVRVG